MSSRFSINKVREDVKCSELVKRLEICSNLFSSEKDQGNACCFEILNQLNKCCNDNNHHKRYIKDMNTWMNNS